MPDVSAALYGAVTLEVRAGVTGKGRRVDCCPDEMILGLAGKLSLLDFGVHWMIGGQIASRDQPNGRCTTRPWTVRTLASHVRAAADGCVS